MNYKGFAVWGLEFLGVVGAINWGIMAIGGQQWNLVNKLFGSIPTLEWVIYLLVGVGGVFLLLKMLPKKK